MEFKIAFIGFGVVGQGLAEILLEQEEFLKKNYDFHFKVVAISDTMKGSCYKRTGLDLRKLLNLVNENGNLKGYGEGIEGWDSIKTIEQTNSNLILEVAWTDLKTGEPAITHVKTALKNKKHVVLTNKGPIALAVRELLDLAKKNDVEMRYEGTVLSGTPALNLGLNNLAGAGITKAMGSYEDALKQAQELGYAEADPTADVEGYDALGKIVILANTVMGANLSKDDPPCEGITKITAEDIVKAKEEGFRWKLIAGAEIKKDGSVDAYVRPEKIPLTHPLANIMGPTNALTYSTKYVSDVTIVGPGAGKLPTGFALLTDILDINRLISKR